MSNDVNPEIRGRPGPTVRDVARLARVSIGTVSRVLNDDPTVRPPMRDAVLRAVKELHYTPNLAARGLRAARTSTIGILVPDLQLPNSARAIRGCEEAAERRGFSVLIADARGDSERQLHEAELLVAKRVDGVLTLPTGGAAELIDTIQGAGIPTVIFGASQGVGESTAAAGVVAVDRSTATMAALRRLAEAGHRDVALAGGTSSLYQVRYGELPRMAEEASGGAMATRILAAEEDELAGSVARSLLSRGQDGGFTAIIAIGEQSLRPTLAGIRHANVQIGPDLSMVGIEGSRWAAAWSPPIDVVDFDWANHLSEATDLLIDIIRGAPAGRVIVHSSRYIERGSVFPAPGEAASGAAAR